MTAGLRLLMPRLRASWRVLGLPALLLGAGGCIRYRPAPLSPAGSAAEYEARSLATLGLLAFVRANEPDTAAAWPPRAWGLGALTLAAFYYQPDLDLARARWAVARAGVVTAGERPNPVLGVAPGVATPGGGGSPWTLGFSLDLPIETFGKRGYRISQAHRLSEAARFGIATAAWGVRDRLRSAFLDFWSATLRSTLTARQQEIQQKVVEALTLRFRVGEASRVELLREQLALERIRLAARDALRLRADARARVAAAVGIPAAALDSVPLSFAAFETGVRQIPPAGELYRRGLTGRADVLGALAEYEAAQSALQLEVARQYPDLRLGPGYAWDQAVNRFTVGLSAVLPLLSRNRGPIAEAEGRRGEAAARFLSLQAGAVGEIDRALVTYRVSVAALSVADSLQEVARRQEHEVRRSFQVGESDRLALLAAEAETAAAELSRAEALTQVQNALGRLETAIQRPLFTGPAPAPALFEPDPRSVEIPQP